MVQVFSPNDMIYVQGVGFCQLISCGKYKTLKLKKNPLYEDNLKPLYLAKQKESLYFDPESFLFNQSSLIIVPPQPVPIALPDALPQLSLSSSRRQSRSQSLIAQQSQIQQQPNIITAKLLQTQYIIYCPDTKISQYIHLKVKTMFCNRQQYSFYININSTILQLKNKVIQLTKQPIANLDNVRLISTNGFVYQFPNNKQLIYQCRMISTNSTLLLLANVRFSIDPNEKGPSVILSNNNRTLAKKAQDGKYQMCLGTIDITNGKVYFQTKIDKISEEDDLFLGIAKKGTTLSIANNLLDKIPFWGYNCMAGRKVIGSSSTDVPPAVSMAQFGHLCKCNDNIGTLIQVQNKIATLSYYINGKFIGKAIDGIQCPISPAVVLGSGQLQITINCLADAPFDAGSYLS